MKDAIYEPGRMIDMNDPKWAHPGFEDNYYINGRKTIEKFTNPETPLETRIAKRDKVYKQLEEAHPAILAMHPEWEEQGETKDYFIPGVAGDDSQIHITVRFPKKRKKKNKTLFYIPGGGIVFGTPYLAPIEEYCYELDCIVVAPWYRSGLDAPYPAAIDDTFAAYKWMIENAAELGVHPDKVVLTGLSVGAMYDICLAFRLKENGFKPRGVVAMDPLFDDREMYLSQRYVNDAWDSDQARRVWNMYLGPENFANPGLGPEAMPGRATVEDCKGLCPMIVHTPGNDRELDPSRVFMDTVRAAGVYTEYHVWGGCIHSTYYALPADNEQRQRYMTVFFGNIKDLWEYDFRRSWLWESEE
ncbi:MAG: alpha/beta hydrolase fold domain-containing protein [Coriobacteriaceae bacterium]|nr:alpha/beta hydrolase fold domain-containing protein [Coriobacteriaceae bacterium]